MKNLRWGLALLLVGILLLVGGCGPSLPEQIETLQDQVNTLQEQIDTLEVRISALEYVPPVVPIDIEEYSSIRIPIGEFQNQPHIDAVMGTVVGGELTVNLGSNPTTGYRWSEDAKISDETIVKQIHHVFLSPGPDVAGAPGEEVWVFKALKRGTTTILLEYSRSWETSRTPDSDIEGVRKASLWTVTIAITIE